MELYAAAKHRHSGSRGDLVFTFVYNRLPRKWLISVLSAFFIVSFLGLARRVAESAPPRFVFYVLGDL
jgi:hypothetical protein